MSDEKPFAWVAPHRAVQGALPPDDDYEVFGWQVVGWPPLAGVFYTQKADAESAAAEVNSAVAARERKAAAKALRDYADEREAEARSFPLGATFGGGGLDDAPMFDVQMREVRSLRSRAAAIEGGAT